MKKFYACFGMLLCFLVMNEKVNGQIIKVPYWTRIIKCAYIFEGEVIKSTPYWDTAMDYI